MECYQDINEEELEKKCKIINSSKCKKLPYIIYQENSKYSVLMKPLLENYSNNRKKYYEGVSSIIYLIIYNLKK